MRNIIFFILLLTSFLPVCSVAERAEVKLGLLVPLSGEYADWGVRVQRGVELALEDSVNKFELFVQDEGACDVNRSVSGYKSLVDFMDVELIIPGCLAGTKANGPLAKAKGILILSPGLIDREVLESGYPLLNFGTVLTQEARYLANLINVSGAKKIGTVRWANAFGEEVNESLKEELQKVGVSMIAEELATGQTQDFTPTLLKFKRLGVDGIVINSLGTQQILILMRQRKQIGITLPVFGNYVVESNLGGVSEQELSLLNEVRYTYPYNSAEGTANKEAFDKRYSLKYGADQSPSANTYFIYDGLRLLDGAVTACQSAGYAAKLPVCVRKKLADGQTHSGISGQMTIRTDGASLRPYGYKAIIDGKFIWTQRLVELQN